MADGTYHGRSEKHKHNVTGSTGIRRCCGIDDQFLPDLPTYREGIAEERSSRPVRITSIREKVDVKHPPRCGFSLRHM